MSKTTTLYAIYDDEEVLLSSVREVRSNNIEIKEVYTPFPVHGLDHELGLKETRLGIAAFIYGCIGLTFGCLLIYYIMIVNWPQDIGGKPNFTFYHNLPAFVPVLFELTVLFAGHLMSITYLASCGLYPGAESDSPDPRTTDDKFLMEIEIDKNIKDVKEILKKTGASEINQKEV